MLEYIYYKGCRREFLLSYFGENLTKVPNRCCDYHGLAKISVGLKEKEFHFSPKKDAWQEILLKMFKEEK